MKYELSDIELQDIVDLLIKVEESFSIKFVDNELKEIATFGQLCDQIISKIELENTNDCTSQQAFYKLTNAISEELNLDKKSITPSTSLDIILPIKHRRVSLKKIENHIGFKLNVLRPPHWVTGFLAITFLLSFILIFIKWKIGLLGICFSIIGFWIANKTGTVLDQKTVGEVAEKMTRENYLKSRTNPSTFNKAEIENLLVEWFCKEFELDKNDLKRESKFGIL
jgi:acyl carrier protein